MKLGFSKLQKLNKILQDTVWNCLSQNSRWVCWMSYSQRMLADWNWNQDRE